MIPYGRQDIQDSDIEAVTNVLRSDFLTQGPAVPMFERAVAHRVGAKFGVACNSATSALHIACLALKLTPGQRLWTVPNTFVASANCARYCGADVDFVDIDPLTWNLRVAALRERLARAKSDDTLPQIVVPVHFAGQPTDQQAIWELAQEYGFRVIEDASHSIGAVRDGERVGSCRWSDITVFSFHPVKIITSGEGGMALTNDPAIAEYMAMFRSHGVTRDPAKFHDEGADTGAWYYEQQLLGFNYRMTDIHAALGASQLKRLEDNVERRNRLARRYTSLLADLPLRLPAVAAGNRSAFHLYVIRLQPEMARRGRRRIFDELRSAGIGVNVHYLPVHLQPYYRDLGFGPGWCPEAEAHGREAITLPLHAALTDTDQDRVVAAVRQAILSA
jgi:UDP-4-amino-4,6-dideoxy-N-acetyl-beta-L-altrosamine transaminase